MKTTIKLASGFAAFMFAALTIVSIIANDGSLIGQASIIAFAYSAYSCGKRAYNK